MIKEGEFAIERSSYNLKDKMDKQSGLHQSTINQVIFNVLKPEPHSRRVITQSGPQAFSPRKNVSRASSLETSCSQFEHTPTAAHFKYRHMLNQKQHADTGRICVVGRDCLVGLTDAVFQRNYTTTLRCLSSKGSVIQMQNQNLLSVIQSNQDLHLSFSLASQHLDNQMLSKIKQSQLTIMQINSPRSLNLDNKRRNLYRNQTISPNNYESGAPQNNSKIPQSIFDTDQNSSTGALKDDINKYSNNKDKHVHPKDNLNKSKITNTQNSSPRENQMNIKKTIEMNIQELGSIEHYTVSPRQCN